MNLAIPVALGLAAFVLGFGLREGMKGGSRIRRFARSLFPSEPMQPGAPAAAAEATTALNADPGRILADLRANRPGALDEAYRVTFSGQLGRLALTHWMAECGVGGRFGAELSAETRAYLTGRHDAAIQLMTAAGFDQASAVLATLTETLGDAADDRHAPAQPTAYAAVGIDASDV